MEVKDRFIYITNVIKELEQQLLTLKLFKKHTISVLKKIPTKSFKTHIISSLINSQEVVPHENDFT